MDSNTTKKSSEVGFGKLAQRGKVSRLMNRDGSFNVERRGISYFCSMSAYHSLLKTTWPRFFAFIAALYLCTNLIFAGAYLALGPEGLIGIRTGDLAVQLTDTFFFSVQTLATIGYGVIHPQTVAANVIVTFESMVGLLEIAIVTGIAFARFSRPSARVIFSDNALVAPFQGGLSLQFRMANIRRSELLEPTVRVVLARLDRREGKESRSYYQLPLYLDRIVFFPGYWTITHIIDEQSPLRGATFDSLRDSDTELLILLTAVDETFSQSVHARTSYKADEIIFGSRFSDMYLPEVAQGAGVDISRLSSTEPA